jgi:sulfhydrogenase subunit alpha
MSRTIVVDHLARIEGHAGITVVLGGDGVERVDFNVTEGIRLFEGLVRGRHCLDVPGIVSRICAICSHGHTITALSAIERALNVTVSAQTRTLRDLAYQGASIESHALHVFCLALPDLLGHPSVVSLAGVNPAAVGMALRLKKLGNTIQEIVGGRAVHPVNYVIGGFGRLPSTDDLLQLKTALDAGLNDCATALALLRTIALPAFVNEPVRCAALIPRDEAFFFGDTVRLSDGFEVPVDQYLTLTNERAVAHSHAKFSLHDGRSYMVGALARLSLHGDLIQGAARDAWNAVGLCVPSTNIVANNLAQFVELVYSVEHALEIVTTLLAHGIADEPPARVDFHAGEGSAATEVPRGTLFHRYELDADGCVVAADVITPTAQNFSNVEDQLRAAVRDGVGESDEVLRFRLEIVARAYDPCVSCSVHAIRVA